MIGSLRGRLEEVVDLGECVSEIVVEVGGVGYRLSVGNRTLADLGGVGDEIRLAVHTHVRESAITLYGFLGSEERRCFEVLIGTHGVGPSLALAILGVHTPEMLAKVVASEDEAALTAVPGVGKKTAARLLVELGTRLDDLLGAPGAGLAVAPGRSGGSRSAYSEVAEALAALGYGTEEVRAAIAELPDEGGVEELLRMALQRLGRRR
jgi:Holliday junction DNA helicase RuvA